MISGDSIGRKSNNNINFGNDPHMSNVHCKINLIGSSFYLEDIASTNGTWLRISPPNVPSKDFILKSKSVFKIGNAAMYEIDRVIEKEISNKANDSMKARFKNGCMDCGKVEKDALLLPCRHNFMCFDCSEKATHCEFCSLKINKVLKIYKC